MSPLGRERPDVEQQGDAVTLKPTSAQNHLQDSVCTPSQMVVWLLSPSFLVSIREAL